MRVSTWSGVGGVQVRSRTRIWALYRASCTDQAAGSLPANSVQAASGAAKNTTAAATTARVRAASITGGGTVTNDSANKRAGEKPCPTRNWSKLPMLVGFRLGSWALSSSALANFSSQHNLTRD